MTRLHRMMSWYVAGVAIPTTAMLILTFRASQDQREALGVISKANEDLLKERAESETTAEKLHAVDKCLRDPLWVGLPRTYRQLRERYPVARHFVLWREGTVVLPIAQPPLAFLAGGGPLAEVEQLEFSGHDVSSALECYQKIAAHAQDEAARALALQRVARCLLKLGRQQESRAIWRRLGEEFPDQPDAFGRPYGLLALFESSGADRQHAEARFDDFQRGRWPLSLEHQVFFLDRFRSVLGTGAVEAASGRLTEVEDLLRAVVPILPEMARQSAPAARYRPLVLDSESIEFWTWNAGGPESGEVRGMAVDPDWITAEFSRRLPVTAQEPDSSPNWVLFGLTTFVGCSLMTGAGLLAWVSLRESRFSEERIIFLEGLWHDVGNSLTAIHQRAQALQSPQQLTSEQRDDDCRIILNRVSDATTVIESALSKAQQESPLSRFEIVLIKRPGILLRACAASFLESAGPDAPELFVEIGEPLPATRLDPTAVSRAVLNLLENARKHSPPGEKIFLRATSLPRFLLVEVKNSGDPIPRREWSRIFQPFYQVRLLQARQGFGLGLSVVRQAVKAHRGRIEIRSTAGEGTVFRLLFPRSA